MLTIVFMSSSDWFVLLQSLLTTGSGGWPDFKDSSTAGSSPLPGDSWNIEVFVDVVKELVRKRTFRLNFQIF